MPRAVDKLAQALARGCVGLARALARDVREDRCAEGVLEDMSAGTAAGVGLSGVLGDMSAGTDAAERVCFAALLEATGRTPPGALAEAIRWAREVAASAVAEVERVAREIAAAGLSEGEEDRLVEGFLAARDPAARAEAGAFYTPAEVIAAQVALTGSVLAAEFGVTLADPSLRIVDPACGTGGYARAIVARGGHGGENVVAIEAMASAWSIAQARLPKAQVRLADALALAPAEIVGAARCVACVGNPPYDRGGARPGRVPPAFEATAPIHAKNLHNAYVHFWGWALGLVARAPGVVCLVTPASFLRGPGFDGMRAALRATFDALWIVELGGDLRGPRTSANVFAGVRTPVCVALGLRRAGELADRACRVRHATIAGADRAAKLAALARVGSLAELAWEDVPEDRRAPLVPAAGRGWAAWPRLAELFHARRSGLQWKRTWPVGPTPELLERRWRALLAAEDRAAALRETAAWTVTRAGVDLWHEEVALPAIASLPVDAPAPRIVRTAWRAYDRMWCLADARLGDRLRPGLWRAHGPAQLYLTSLLSTAPLSEGPGVVACAEVPDLHHFRGSFGAADVLPLWLDAAATRSNVRAEALERWGAALGRAVTPDELVRYVVGCIGHPGYVARLHAQLAEPGPRVPLTADPRLFAGLVALGGALVCAQTYGARMRPEGWRAEGRARCVAAIEGVPQRVEHRGEVLSVGTGAFAPVDAAAWGYAVSGLPVVRSWLRYRMLRPGGRTSSPLDAIRPARWTEALTAELLELLWAIERAVELHPRQDALLGEVLAGPLVGA